MLKVNNKDTRTTPVARFILSTRNKNYTRKLQKIVKKNSMEKVTKKSLKKLYGDRNSTKNATRLYFHCDPIFIVDNL